MRTVNTNYSKCWANYRGDCDRGMSDEHLLSKALFPEKVVYVSGFSWCGEKEHRIGINSLQRRFLCTKHNNDLSLTDEEGARAVKAFALGKTEKALHGPLLERWLLKTAINLSIDSELHIGCGMNNSTPSWPSPYLLAVAYGDLPFSAKMGMYFLIPCGSYAHRDGEIVVVPIHRDGEIGGFLFGLRGQFVFLSLFPGHVPPNLGTLVPELFPAPLNVAEMIYRPRSISIQIECGIGYEIGIDWPL
jgi:hypothetical protein